MRRWCGTCILAAGRWEGWRRRWCIQSFEWNLFLPVDMPFLPSAFLHNWVRQTLHGREEGSEAGDVYRGWRAAACAVDGAPGCDAVCDGRGGARGAASCFRCWRRRVVNLRRGRMCCSESHFAICDGVRSGFSGPLRVSRSASGGMAGDDGGTAGGEASLVCESEYAGGVCRGGAACRCAGYLGGWRWVRLDLHRDWWWESLLWLNRTNKVDEGKSRTGRE